MRSLNRFAKISSLCALCHSVLWGRVPSDDLERVYESCCEQWSDIQAHVPRLSRLAEDCSSVAEIGIRGGVSTRGLLRGLAKSPAESRSYLGIDIASPSPELLDQARELSEKNGISFQFLRADDLTIRLDPVDMLFIDSFHIYCHLTYELETFSGSVRKYIAMHDTSEPWGPADEPYGGDYSEYGTGCDPTKQGLWTAVEDFLSRHPEWELSERYFDSHGFTVLKRVKNSL